MKAETKKLIEMVEKGILAKKIEEELGIQTRVSLRSGQYRWFGQLKHLESMSFERGGLEKGSVFN